LLGRFDHQEDSAHPRIGWTTAAAIGVDWKIAVVTEPPAGYEGAAFATFAEPRFSSVASPVIVNES